ncbi:MAG: flagellar basal-body MS-ring/collar protein FliF [Amphiplicatus sp.]
MQGLVSVWRLLTPAKRITLLAAAGATIFVFSILARVASHPSMTLLYAGLEGRAAGDVVSALERMDTPFEIRGEAIYVPAAERDSIKMSLAGQGLPTQGQAGYELLDKLNGFSTTSDMFDATYWRAKEGELARTILSTPGVRAARVHIGNPHAGAFSRHAPSPTGVVTVTMGADALTAGQAQAIRFLVASAVPGLASDQVAVIDSARGVILSPGSDDEIMPDQKTAADRESQMERDIINLLEARVGPGNARAKVALELDMEREAVSERVFNPDGRVISGKETTEVSETSSGGGGGSAVTVASNLPEGDAPGAGAPSRAQRTETKETIKYDMSEVKREREKLPGAIRRLSVAVFVNQIAEEPAEDGGEPVMRTDDEIEKLKMLVSMAVGFNEARGDTLTIEALPFKAMATGGVEVKSNPIGAFMERHLMNAIQIIILAVVTIVLGLFVVKPLLSAKDAPAPALTSSNPAQAAAISAPAQADVLPAAPSDPILTLKEIASSKTDETASLIRAWLETEDAA